MLLYTKYLKKNNEGKIRELGIKTPVNFYDMQTNQLWSLTAVKKLFSRWNGISSGNYQVLPVKYRVFGIEIFLNQLGRKIILKASEEWCFLKKPLAVDDCLYSD